MLYVSGVRFEVLGFGFWGYGLWDGLAQPHLQVEQAERIHASGFGGKVYGL
jgi:hypothetical protein